MFPGTIWPARGISRRVKRSQRLSLLQGADALATDRSRSQGAEGRRLAQAKRSIALQPKSTLLPLQELAAQDAERKRVV